MQEAKAISGGNQTVNMAKLDDLMAGDGFNEEEDYWGII